MLAKPVVLGFLAGIGLTAAVVGGVWMVDRGGSDEAAELQAITVADATLTGGSVEAGELVAVDETEAIVEEDSTSEPATPAPAAAPPPARPVSTPVNPAPTRRAEPTPPIERAPTPPPAPREAEAAPAERDPADRGAAGVPADDAPSPIGDDARPASEPAADEEWPVDDEPVTGRVRDEPVRAESWEPAAPSFEDLVISADSVISLQVDTSISTETARIEDRVEARTLRDVQVGGETAIPAGSLALASVTLVEPGGKVRERARLGIRFHTIVLGDGSEVPIQTETIYREGRSPAKSSSAKIGGAATAGAILGAIFGGKKGAVIGGAAGAAGGTAATMAGGRNPATISAGTPVTIRLQEPATVIVER